MIQLSHTTEVIATVAFAVAIFHTFMTGYFNKLATKAKPHGVAQKTLHALGEVELVFGIWAALFCAVFAASENMGAVLKFLESLSFTEPAFVFCIMVVAATRPILQAAEAIMEAISKTMIPFPGSLPIYATLMVVGPILGSFITEPAAMTVTALLVRNQIFSRNCSTRLMYATLGPLFVNVSIGGVLTPFAAPPVVMVARVWQWDTWFMLSNFGWKAVIAVVLNTAVVCAFFWKELAAMRPIKSGLGSKNRSGTSADTPIWIKIAHFAFIVGIVAASHHMTVFLGLLLLFVGFTELTSSHQDQLRIRESMLVAFFLAGLVVLGKGQEWWLRPLLEGSSDKILFLGTTALTAITDNAALTYLASQVPELSESARYAIVAGAVAGGGLTVIANAPNPAGYAILKDSFPNGGIHPLNLFLGALIPTIIAALSFKML